MIVCCVCRSIPPDRLKQLTDFIESDVIIRYNKDIGMHVTIIIDTSCSHRSIHDVKATDMGNYRACVSLIVCSDMHSLFGGVQEQTQCGLRQR